MPQSLGPQKRNYPLNCWWVAAEAADLSDKPIPVRLFNQPIVLYRKSNGQLAALEDRCPHRWAPLSGGRLENDTLVCPYHGFRFDSSGACTNIPSQKDIAAGMRVRTYPVTEHGGYIWLWPGDDTKADTSLLPDMPWFTDPNHLVVKGAMTVNCNYMLIQENVMDLTHFAHLHADTLQQSGWGESLPEVKLGDNSVTYEHRFENEALAPFQAIPMGLEPGRMANRLDWGTFCSPACHIAGIDVKLVEPQHGRTDYNFRIMHLTTPIRPDKTAYWWITAQNYGVDDPEAETKLQEMIDVTFAQDKDVLERIQSTIQFDYRGAGAPEVSVQADRGALQARRVLQAMLNKEMPADNIAAQ